MAEFSLTLARYEMPSIKKKRHELSLSEEHLYWNG